MNDPLSSTDIIQNSSTENNAYQIENSKDLAESEQNNQSDESSDSQNTNKTANDGRKEEEIIGAPSDGERTSSLVDRLKRSLGVPAEEVSWNYNYNNH